MAIAVNDVRFWGNVLQNAGDRGGRVGPLNFRHPCCFSKKQSDHRIGLDRTC